MNNKWYHSVHDYHPRDLSQARIKEPKYITRAPQVYIADFKALTGDVKMQGLKRVADLF